MTPSNQGRAVTNARPHPVAPAAADPNLLRELAAARALARPIRRAAACAAFSGWTTIAFGTFSILMGLFSVPALLLGTGLVTVGIVELWGRRRLLRCDARAPIVLAANQLLLLGMISAYCAWNLAAPTEAAAPSGSPEVDRVLRDIESLSVIVRRVIYGGAMAISAVFQGSAAVYYYTRRRSIREYVDRTPGWVREVQRVAA